VQISNWKTDPQKVVSPESDLKKKKEDVKYIKDIKTERIFV
jgi:hypothetical protein